MLFGVLGDIHGEFDTLNAIVARHADVAFWLSVGDVASDDLQYPQPGAPLHWIQGNNEDFDFIARRCLAGPKPCATSGGRPCAGHPNLYFLPNGTCTVVEGVAVGGLGGTFAPTWYETPAAELPCRGKVKVRDDKRRHFVREQVESLKASGPVDVLLTHEAPRPFIVQAAPRRIDAGKTAVNEVIAALHPRLHFFGHHHRFSDTIRTGVRSIGLDLIMRSYVLVDRHTFEIVKVDLTG